MKSLRKRKSKNDITPYSIRNTFRKGDALENRIKVSGGKVVHGRKKTHHSKTNTLFGKYLKLKRKKKTGMSLIHSRPGKAYYKRSLDVPWRRSGYRIVRLADERFPSWRYGVDDGTIEKKKR